jgi:DNA-binding MarR family transcriptional regulator
VLKRLEGQRLLRKRPDPRDGRRTLLSLTEQGRAIDVEVEGSVESAVQRVLATMPSESIHAAREVLTEIAKRLDAPAEDAEEPPVE